MLYFLYKNIQLSKIDKISHLLSEVGVSKAVYDGIDTHVWVGNAVGEKQEIVMGGREVNVDDML